MRTELVDWLYHVNFATVCKCRAMLYVSTYVLFSTLKCLLTMIQQLYIHLVTDLVITHANVKFDFWM